MAFLNEEDIYIVSIFTMIYIIDIRIRKFQDRSNRYILTRNKNSFCSARGKKIESSLFIINYSELFLFSFSLSNNFEIISDS